MSRPQVRTRNTTQLLQAAGLLLAVLLLASCRARPLAPVARAAPAPTPQPLEDTVKFALQEQAGAFLLELHSQSIYACTNYHLLSDLQRQPGVLTITLLGSLLEAPCAAGPGPARGVIELGELEGDWQLHIRHGSLQDSYDLTITAEQASAAPLQAEFTHLLFPRLQRLPPDSFWLLVFRPLAHPGGEHLVIDHLDYQQAAADFFAEVEALGAQPYQPQAEPYTNVNFLPTTPMRGRVNDPAVLVPVSQEGQLRPYLLLNWPQVRYYTHPQAAALQPQIERALLDSQPQGELLQAVLFLPDGSLHALPRRH